MRHSVRSSTFPLRDLPRRARGNGNSVRSMTISAGSGRFKASGQGFILPEEGVFAWNNPARARNRVARARNREPQPAEVSFSAQRAAASQKDLRGRETNSRLRRKTPPSRQLPLRL